MESSFSSGVTLVAESKNPIGYSPPKNVRRHLCLGSIFGLNEPIPAWHYFDSYLQSSNFLEAKLIWNVKAPWCYEGGGGVGRQNIPQPKFGCGHLHLFTFLLDLSTCFCNRFIVSVAFSNYLPSCLSCIVFPFTCVSCFYSRFPYSCKRRYTFPFRRSPSANVSIRSPNYK